VKVGRLELAVDDWDLDRYVDWSGNEIRDHLGDERAGDQGLSGHGRR
jgi:hypothetical protein